MINLGKDALMVVGVKNGNIPRDEAMEGVCSEFVESNFDALRPELGENAFPPAPGESAFCSVPSRPKRSSTEQKEKQLKDASQARTRHEEQRNGRPNRNSEKAAPKTVE